MAIEAHENLLHVPDGRRDPTLIGTFLRVQPKPRIDTAPKGKTLIQEDDFADHSMLLLEGWIAFSKMLPDGGVQIIDVMLPGDFAPDELAQIGLDSVGAMLDLHLTPDMIEEGDTP